MPMFVTVQVAVVHKAEEVRLGVRVRASWSGPSGW